MFSARFFFVLFCLAQDDLFAFVVSACTIGGRAVASRFPPVAHRAESKVARTGQDSFPLVSHRAEERGESLSREVGGGRGNAKGWLLLVLIVL